MLDWSKVTGMLDICALYYTTQLVRCAAFSFALLALVMMLRRFICSERTFAKAALWALFLITPFMGRLKLFYENKAVVKMTAWMTDITMSNLWVGRLYLAGILLTAICIFGRQLRLRRKVAAMEAMTIKGTYVRVVNENVTPFAIGLARSYIVLPRAMLEQYGEEDLLAVIQHEKTHIRLGHLWYYFVWDTLRCLLWVNVSLSICQKHFRADMEDMCDRVCIQNSGKTPQEYGLMLLKSLKLLRFEQAGISSLVTYAGEKDFVEMKRRMVKIADFKTYKKGACKGMAVLVAAAVCTVWSAIYNYSYPRCGEMENMLVYQYDGEGALVSDDTAVLKRMISYDGRYVYVEWEAFESFLRESNAQGEVYIVFGGFQKLPGMGGGASSCRYERCEADLVKKVIRLPYERQEDWALTLLKVL